MLQWTARAPRRTADVRRRQAGDSRVVLLELDVEPIDRILKVGYEPGLDIKVATDAGREHVRSLVAFYVRAMGNYYANVASDFGFDEEVDTIQISRTNDRQPSAEVAVTDEMVSAFGATGTSRRPPRAPSGSST